MLYSPSSRRVDARPPDIPVYAISVARQKTARAAFEWPRAAHRTRRACSAERLRTLCMVLREREGVDVADRRVRAIFGPFSAFLGRKFFISSLIHPLPHADYPHMTR